MLRAYLRDTPSFGRVTSSLSGKAVIVSWLEIHSEPSDVFLCSYSEDGEFQGDSWHESVEDAKEYAKSRYGISVDHWRNV